MSAPTLRNLTSLETLKTFSGGKPTFGVPSAMTTVQIVTTINIIYTPLLIILGTIGNLASVFVFYKTKLRLQSTSQYLSALAISDTVFLSQLLPPWLNAVHVADIFNKDGFCQVFVYVSYVTCSLSAWFVVFFTIERFVAVLYPLKRNFLCTVKRARYVICGTVCMTVLLNIPVIRFASPKKNRCDVDREYLDYAAMFNIFDTVVSFTIPLLAIGVLNSCIIKVVYRVQRARRKLLRGRPTSSVGHRNQTIRQDGCQRSQQRVTRMLLIVSTVYVCLNLPAYLLRLIAYAYNMHTKEYSGHWAAAQQVAVMLFNTNFGINFILYCYSGQNFREALTHCLLWRRRRDRLNNMYGGASYPVRRSMRTGTTNSQVGRNIHATPPPTRRRRERYFISRWTFDNSRQRRQQARNNRSDGNTIEMVDIVVHDHPGPRRR